MNESVITFKNTNFAIKAEKCLLENNHKVCVMPLPNQISAGCGICLRVGETEVTPALNTLAGKQIEVMGCYSRIEKNGSFSYEETNRFS
ncbi:MAG: DUF3343 domain-containing protein [Defluviitaleaceae bacterium]|nr:DUF3343 domain-containing protein [Defluviitaleaceae bacterium]